MPNRDWKLFIIDIFDCAQKILSYTQGMEQKQFFEDSQTYDAVLRNLEIIGEAAQNLPNEIKKKYTNIDWKKIAGLRDIAIHKYFGINQDILWDIVSHKIPELESKITEMVSKEVMG
jgi:uncharacterized protein with HEPN domain